MHRRVWEEKGSDEDPKKEDPNDYHCKRVREEYVVLGAAALFFGRQV